METKKLTQQEIYEIDIIQKKNQLIIQELGQIQILKLQLEKREQTTQQYLEDILQEQDQISQQLVNIYGKGTVNMETGEFTPFE